MLSAWALLGERSLVPVMGWLGSQGHSPAGLSELREEAALCPGGNQGHEGKARAGGLEMLTVCILCRSARYFPGTTNSCWLGTWVGQ